MKSLVTGYMVVRNEDSFVFEHSFAQYRRNARQTVRQIFSELTDKEFKEQYSTVRAVQTTEVINWE